MITLFTTLISFLTGGLPSLLGFFQDKSDKKHELELARLQTERELELLEKGYAAQARVEEIKTQQIEMQTQVQERQSLYAHDIEILWDDETQIIWASVVSFWFGTQAFKK